jgi:ABC-type uncharacterized transport system substrate-binding protein
MFRQSALMIDKILKGAKPSELPVEQPWRYDLAINLKTAKALGLAISTVAAAPSRRTPSVVRRARFRDLCAGI